MKIRKPKENANNGQKVVKYGDGQDRFDLVISDGSKMEKIHCNGKEEKMEIHLDGPFGAPASNIFRY